MTTATETSEWNDTIGRNMKNNRAARAARIKKKMFMMCSAKQQSEQKKIQISTTFSFIKE